MNRRSIFTATFSSALNCEKKWNFGCLLLIHQFSADKQPPLRHSYTLFAIFVKCNLRCIMSYMQRSPWCPVNCRWRNRRKILRKCTPCTCRFKARSIDETCCRTTPVSYVKAEIEFPAGITVRRHLETRTALQWILVSLKCPVCSRHLRQEARKV